VRAALKELKVQVADIESMPPSGESLPSEIRRRIESADFVCGVVVGDEATGRNFSENVIFELGIALGCERPIFIVANSSEQIPYSLSSYPHILGALRNREAIQFHIGVFLKSLNIEKRLEKSPPKSTPKEEARAHSHRFEQVGEFVERETLENYRAELEQIRHRVDRVGSDVDLTRDIARIFEIAGASVADKRVGAEQMVPDLVAWFREPAADLGQAILVEVKRKLRDPSTIESASKQVDRYMSAAGIRAGVLLGADGPDEVQIRFATSGYIFLLSVNALISMVAKGRLTKGLLEARNRYVHTGA
jgi:hypothetical protein